MVSVRAWLFESPRAVALAAAVAVLLVLNYVLPDDSFRAHAFLLTPLRYATEAAGGPVWQDLYNAGGEHIGYISADLRFRLAPECSGLRFFSLTLVLGALLGAASWKGALLQCCAAYGLALLATTARIVFLFKLAGVAPAFAAERHAWIGAAIYLVCFIFYGALLARAQLRPGSPPTRTRYALPGDVT